MDVTVHHLFDILVLWLQVAKLSSPWSGSGCCFGLVCFKSSATHCRWEKVPLANDSLLGVSQIFYTWKCISHLYSLHVSASTTFNVILPLSFFSLSVTHIKWNKYKQIFRQLHTHHHHNHYLFPSGWFVLRYSIIQMLTIMTHSLCMRIEAYIHEKETSWVSSHWI